MNSHTTLFVSEKDFDSLRFMTLLLFVRITYVMADISLKMADVDNWKNI